MLRIYAEKKKELLFPFLKKICPFLTQLHEEAAVSLEESFFCCVSESLKS